MTYREPPMNAVDLFIKKHALTPEAESELRVLMRGDPIETGQLGHEPMRPLEAAVIADMARLSLTKQEAYRLFRDRVGTGFERSARWIRDHYQKAWLEHTDQYDYNPDPSPMAQVAEAIGQAESAAAAWFVAKDVETRSARWAEFVHALQEVAYRARAEARSVQRERAIAQEALRSTRGDVPYGTSDLGSPGWQNDVLSAVDRQMGR